MTRKLFVFALIFMLFTLLLSGCYIEVDPLGTGEAEKVDVGNFSGSVSGIARGFSSDIRVTLTFVNGSIVNAEVASISGSESQGIGTVVVQKAPALIVARQSVDIADACAGASRTANGIKEAGTQAIDKVVNSGSASMKSGTYVARATHNYGGDFDVAVTVSQTAILGIIVASSNESLSIGQPAIPIIIERIINAQTTGVDSVSGATLTSNSLKDAVAKALEEAGASLSMSQPVKPPDGIYEYAPVSVDVLIVGSGAAGLSAAIAAASYPSIPPISVMVIEKEVVTGGSTRLSDGIIYAANSTADASINVDSIENYFMYRAQGNNGADRSLVKAYAEKSVALVDGSWVLPNLSAVALPRRGSMAEAIRTRVIPGGGTSLVNILENKAKEMGVVILTGIEATNLEKNSYREVVQVLAKSNTAKYAFNARRGVVVASGGFDSDTSETGYLAQKNSDSVDAISRSKHSNIGQGITMGDKAGAELVFKGGRIGRPVIPEANIDIPNGRNILVMSSLGNKWVDLSGPAAGGGLDAVNWSTNPYFASYSAASRDEEEDLSLVFTELVRMKEADSDVSFYQFSKTPFPGVGKFTHDILAEGSSTPLSHSQAFVANNMEEIIDGWSLHYDTAGVETLLAQRGFTDTLIGSGQYYFWHVEPASIGSMGGLKINNKAQVVGKAGTQGLVGGVLPGLYAAGEVANGGFYYKQNPADGSSLGIAMTFGRIAGEEAAKAPIKTPRTSTVPTN